VTVGGESRLWEVVALDHSIAPCRSIGHGFLNGKLR